MEAGMPFAVVGNAYRSIDFLSRLQDARMVALSIDQRWHEPIETKPQEV